MSCPEVSGYVEKILVNLGDEEGNTWPSGKVEKAIFASLPMYNGLMGTDFQNISGCIYPSMSGTIYEGVLEALVAKELVRKQWISQGSSFTMTSIKEGDSTVTIADRTKVLETLYKQTTADFNLLLQQSKFSIASNSPCTVIGVDYATPSSSN